MKRNSQAGVALVITLILLSVITFMAVTFLVVSRREAGQVSTLTQQSNAKFAAEAALEHAKSLIIANMLTAANGYNFGLLVSTNYNSTYTNTGSYVNSLLNVGYTYPNNGGVLSAADEAQMLNNQLILPRPPVFIRTNSAFPNALDFRYYLDLNRNGMADTNGLVPLIDTNGIPVLNAGVQVYTNYVGDPEWIGVLAHPDMRHSSSNQYIARYCFIALPIGNSLDINYIHNDAITSSGPLGSGFLRNQGVGSWEINLAGFLNGLSPSTWDYNYYPLAAGGPSSSGYAFLNAAAVLNYRYNGGYYNLQTVYQSYGNNGSIALGGDFIDEYSTGPLMTNLYYPLFADPDYSLVRKKSWSGSDNPNQYFTPGDLFNHVPLGSLPAYSFSSNLYQLGANTSRFKGTEDHYSFYRLLSQMSFGSSPEPAPYPFTNKINLNYNNLTSSATNFTPWTDIQFFTNAADRMLRKTFPNPMPIVINNVTNYYTISITNIPLYPASLYTPAVQRILQLAANIYDSSTNRVFDSSSPNGPFYPSVFRPTFNRSGNYVYVSGYTNDYSSTANISNSWNTVPLYLPDDAALVNSGTVSIYGIPWIIGAKKGLPNFNEFSLQSVSQITRKIQLVKNNLTDSKAANTNVQYVIGISNVLGVECWNSYASLYPRGVTITVFNNLTTMLTNELGILNTNGLPSANYCYSVTNILPSYWPAYTGGNSGLIIPLLTNVVTFPSGTNLYYHANASPHLNNDPTFDTGSQYALPHFGFSMTNRLRVVMTDTATGRVIDYFHFGTNIFRDLTGELPGGDGTTGGNNDAGIWSTNLVNPAVNFGGTIVGVIQQIQVAMGITNWAPTYPNFTSADWANDQLTTTSQSDAITQMRTFLSPNASNTVQQVPFVPTRKVSLYFTWQANDPLVHYTVSDLAVSPPDIISNPKRDYWIPASTTNSVLPNIQVINNRYHTWGDVGSPKGVQGDANHHNLAVKDPGITGSDAWQFPTNKYPNIGWLGRVHRGTPWQTVYLKSTPIDQTNWVQWSGNTLTNNYNFYNDSLLTQPTNDWALLDLFTTSPNDNASRGQLSVNQTGAAAWAAILDGVLAVSNNATAGFVPMVIDPANVCYVPGVGLTNTVQYLINSINATRNLTNFNGTFTSVGQICAVPQLTVQSPYLDTVSSATNLLTDAAYERIPQQILSLLRLGSPRYAIFAYGQSLKPAPASIVQSGSLFGMCTNYQITGEMATRTIVRFDNFPAPGQTTAPKAVVESFNVLAPE